MNITFYGAAGEVTGSCTLLETNGKKILVDCGMFQGSDFNEARNADPLPFNAAELDAVLVTHAHLDHVGRLPVLIKNGYKGFFYATAPTAELAIVVIEDALNIMKFDHAKFGRAILYADTDVAEVESRFKKIEYGVKTKLSSDDTFATFHDAGHIFGSSFIEVEAPPEDGQAKGKRVVFSGDVGNVNVPILRDTENLPKEIDALICESTYGDRLHETPTDRTHMVEHFVADGLSRGGVLMIPSFSIERTQELIYELNDLIDRHHQLPRVPIFLDSPMAIDAIKVFRKYPQYFDAEAAKYFRDGDDLFVFDGLVSTRSREESMKINSTPGPKIIIAGAGMMNGGRILHHALRYLSDDKNTLLIVGYQSAGTLGRQIMNGESPVMVLGEKVQVHCKVMSIGALSAHGDQNKLVSWVGAAKPKKVFLNHGDPAASQALSKRLQSEHKLNVHIAEPAKTIDI